MKPNVVIAYPSFGDLAVEQDVLSRIDATIHHVGNLT